MHFRTSANTFSKIEWYQLLLVIQLGLAELMISSSAVCQMSGPAKTADLENLARDGERQLEDGRSTLDVQTLTTARRMFEECARQEEKNSRCYYDLAQTAFCLEKAEELEKHNDAAKRWLDTAIADAQSAVTLNDQSADAHALFADMYGAKISGMISGRRYGSKANAETQRAFQLAPDNPRAFAVIGRKYLYAPSMSGGDLDKAIESFQKATTF
jgi:tetratricopeptide (TPR) repeat protein